MCGRIRIIPSGDSKHFSALYSLAAFDGKCPVASCGNYPRLWNRILDQQWRGGFGPRLRSRNLDGIGEGGGGPPTCSSVPSW